jgi:hypothetical protein
MGAAFTLLAMLSWLLGNDLVAEVVLALLLVPATLEAGFGYCVGCKIFAYGIHLGLVPETICVECGDLYGPDARKRRDGSAEQHAA